MKLYMSWLSHSLEDGALYTAPNSQCFYIVALGEVPGLSLRGCLTHSVSKLLQENQSPRNTMAVLFPFDPPPSELSC